MNQFSDAVRYLEDVEKMVQSLEAFRATALSTRGFCVRLGPITAEEELRLAKKLNIHLGCAKGALEEFARGRGLL